MNTIIPNGGRQLQNAGTAIEERAVPGAVHRLEKLLNSTAGLLGELEQRLDPVTRKEAATPSQPAPPPGKSPALADELQMLAQGLEHQNTRIQELLRLLEL